jgi:hypothetical protein
MNLEFQRAPPPFQQYGICISVPFPPKQRVSYSNGTVCDSGWRASDFLCSAESMAKHLVAEADYRASNVPVPLATDARVRTQDAASRPARAPPRVSARCRSQPPLPCSHTGLLSSCSRILSHAAALRLLRPGSPPRRCRAPRGAGSCPAAQRTYPPAAGSDDAGG